MLAKNRSFLKHSTKDSLMSVTQLRSKRKPSGGRYRDWRKKRLRDTGSEPAHTRSGARAVHMKHTMGGNRKVILLREEIANVYIADTKKYEKLKIETIVSNPANRHFVRRNIMTKGTIIKTAKGNARITSRPAQDGMINAVLVK